MKENIIPLPELCGKGVSTEYFPTKMQAFIFRNWGMVAKEKIADVLGTSVSNVEKQAYKMGLSEQGDVSAWMIRGYISIIKLNWDLISYEQMLKLLDWSEDRLAVVLKEEDFLEFKLGSYKPICDNITYCELTPEQEETTKLIKNAILKWFPTKDDKHQKQPFNFFEKKEECFSITSDKAWKIVNLTNDENVSFMLSKFEERLKNNYGVLISNTAASKITVSFFEEEKEEEYHEIITNDDSIKIIAADSAAVMRAIIYIEDIIKSSKKFSFEKKHYKRSAEFKTRFIYSFCGLYNDAFDVDSNIYCPDELLESYAQTGINGIWLQAVMYMLTEFPFAPEISKGHENRLKNLKTFCDRAAKYGIKIYLYINEPRGMPLEFFKNYPELLGNQKGNIGCLCTETEPVKQYLKDGITAICSAVPNLGGFFTITKSENITNCYSLTCEMTCPRCKDKKHYEVISEVNSLIANSASAVNPKIKVFAWDWAWRDFFMSKEEIDKCIELMPKNVILMSNRDIKLPTNVGGIKGEVNDYSISVCGISERAKEGWDKALMTGHETAAKVQINNSWECSTIPYLPVYKLVENIVDDLLAVGVRHIMLSWTLGGYPSPNIKIVSNKFFKTEGEDISEDLYKSLYGENSEVIHKATDIFSAAFREYPFDFMTLYTGPHNGGIANPIYDVPTDKKATMTCFAYDDLETWRAIYPEDIFENQFKKVYMMWEKGLELLESVPECEFLDIAKSTYIQFKSSYNQIRFIRIRDDIKNKDEMISLLNSEIKMASEMFRIMQQNPAIGFEAANHYYYTQGMIMEKVINCEYIISKLNNLYR